MSDQRNDDCPQDQTQNENCHPERSGTQWSAVEGPAVAKPFKTLSSRPDPDRAQRVGGGVEGPAVPATPANEPYNPLAQLRRFTPARIALGRSGDSLPTRELLDFSLAYALARDAVHAALDAEDLIAQLNSASLEYVQVSSAAPDRATYLRRPDLGRTLDQASRNRFSSLQLLPKPEIVFIIADGLSAIAPQRYAVPVIQLTRALLEGWQIGPVIIAEQARVALGDEIGELLQAEITVMLIGERPGLSAPDSLGIYLTYEPRIGRNDAERNCISNVRNEGKSAERATQTLHYLLAKSRCLKLSGVALKDDSEAQPEALPVETHG